MNHELETSAETSTEVTTTTPAKKVAKKKAAPKKAAAKKVAKKAPAKKTAQVVSKEPLKASSIAEAVKVIKKSEQKLGTIKINGKTYSFTHRTSWCISKNLLANGKDGLIMVIKEEGHYIYPANKYKELFGKIMKSKTWSEIGNYSQSTLPQWHAEYFTALK